MGMQLVLPVLVQRRRQRQLRQRQCWPVQRDVVQRRRLHRWQGLEPRLYGVSMSLFLLWLMLIFHARPIAFTAQYNPGSSGGSLAVYGWSENPLVEYYIMEDFPSPPTGGLTQVGTLTSDGSSYTFYKHQQVNQPSIVSTSSTFEQYISIRQSPRQSGTVTVANHFNAWKAAGLNLGSLNYQILSTESYGGGSGSSTVTVSQGSSSPAPSSGSPTSTAPVSTGTPPPSGSCSGMCSQSRTPVFHVQLTYLSLAIYGQCGGIGWTVRASTLEVKSTAHVVYSGRDLLLFWHL
jgi:hypothetical protein